MDFVVISGSSMSPTYLDGDIVLVQKTCESIERYDIVVVSTRENGHEKIIIKRVMGMPGEVFQIQDGVIYVNDKLLADVVSEKMKYAGMVEEPIIIGADQYFVLGDNRNHSNDSRFEGLGLVDKSEILGKVIFSFRRGGR